MLLSVPMRTVKNMVASSSTRVLQGPPSKKPFIKKNFPHKKSPSRMVLVTREEYISGDEDSEDEESAEVAAIAITSSSSPSLFESPNEDAPTTSATCLMAKATEVISSSTPKTINDMHDHIGLRIKEENVALNRFMSNLKGEAKGRFESLLRKT